MRYLMPDGTTVQGRSYDVIVQRMAATKLAPVRSLEGYRRATAQRVREIYGLTVDPTTSRSLVLSMVEVGLMKPGGGS